MKTVIILGAGASRAPGNNKPMHSKPPLDADFFSIARAAGIAEHDKVVSSLKNLVGDYSSTLTKSLEISASYLYLKAIDSSPGSIYHRGFLDLLSLINKTLARTTNNISLGPRSLLYRFLLGEIKKVKSPSNLTIITFNYDLLAERTLYEIAKNNGDNYFCFPGCYCLTDIASTPGIKGYLGFGKENLDHKGVGVLKLHGSLNWQSKHTSDSPNPGTMFSPKRAIHVMNSLKIANALSWKPRKRRVYMKPIIIPPISGKRGMMHNSMRHLWSTAAKRLRKADRIVIAGYSCPPLDLEARILLSENLRQNDMKKLYVIDPSGESAAKFIDLCGVNHSTIYSSLRDWVNDARL